MGKKESLTTSQLQAAKELDKTLKNLRNIAEELKQYKIGDIYVLEEWDNWDPKNVIVKETTLGFPVKFKVCYISTEGIPYLRKITNKGNPTGEVYLPPEAIAVNSLRRSAWIGDPACQRFVPDPEQMDSILLQQEFDPMAQQRDKSKLYNEINKHNKNVSVPTSHADFNKIADFFKSKLPGDKFWTSPDKQYVIQSVTKVGKQYEIKCTDMNQQTVTFNFSYFTFRRLYSKQPRSFTKESVK